MPRPEPAAPALDPLSLELIQQAASLRQRSRFLRRRSHRLLGRSNDLLTVLLFQRERSARLTTVRPPLALIS